MEEGLYYVILGVLAVGSFLTPGAVVTFELSLPWSTLTGAQFADFAEDVGGCAAGLLLQATRELPDSAVPRNPSSDRCSPMALIVARGDRWWRRLVPINAPAAKSSRVALVRLIYCKFFNVCARVLMPLTNGGHATGPLDSSPRCLRTTSKQN